MMRRFSRSVANVVSTRRSPGIVIPTVSWFTVPNAFRLLSSTLSLRADKGTDGGRTHGRRHIGYDERQAKRVRPSREERLDKQHRLEEGERYSSEGFVAEANGIFEEHEARARVSMLKITNPALALERVPIDVGGGAPKRPLSQLASIVKLSRNELEITVNNLTHVSPIMQRLPRYDHSLSPLKTAENKVKVTLVQVTRERRERICAEIDIQRSEFLQRMKTLRNSGVALIKDLDLDDDTTKMFCDAIDEHVKSIIDEKKQRFIELQNEILVESDDDSSADEPPSSAPPA